MILTHHGQGRYAPRLMSAAAPGTLPRIAATANGVEIVVLSAFGDESADDKGERVFAIAAVVGDEDGWRAAKRAWLDRTGGEIFHASTCESEFANDPDKSKHKANLRLYADLITIIAQSKLVGYSSVLDLMAFRECFPETLPDAGFYKCFMDVIRRTAEATMAAGEQIEYTFHHRQASEYNAGLLYDLFVNLPEWQPNLFMRTKVSFDSIANPSIQIADLVAREAMKLLDNEIGPRKREVRASLRALGESGSFKFDILGREYCTSWRDQAPAAEAVAGYTEQDYRKWIASHGLADNWTNRFRFRAWLPNKEVLS
jgi:hypothetical protein